MKYRVTKNNRRVGGNIRASIEYEHKAGRDDKGFRIAQTIGHRKPYETGGTGLKHEGKWKAGRRNDQSSDPDIRSGSSDGVHSGDSSDASDLPCNRKDEEDEEA